LIATDSYKDRLNPSILKALELHYGFLDLMKNSPAFSDEDEQRDIKYLQSRHTGTVLSDHMKSIQNLIITANVDQKHRKELWTILNKTSQGHLAEYMSGSECKLVCNM